MPGPTQVNTATFIADTVLLIRDTVINDNVTDPISATRPSGERFCLSTYPRRAVSYPVVTVVDRGISNWKKGGMASTVMIQDFSIEIRVWARNVVERDEISQDILDELRGRMNTLSTTQLLHNFRISSMVNVDEGDEVGENVVRSKVITITCTEIIG